MIGFGIGTPARGARLLVALASPCLLAAAAPPAVRAPVPFTVDPYPSTYAPGVKDDFLIRNVTILDGRGGKLESASVLVRRGKIAAINPSPTGAAGARVIDGTGRWLTPGLVDVHSHDGDIAAPSEAERPADVTEGTDPNSAHVWAEHSINVQDPNFARGLASGITTVHVLPGSSNIFGGRTVVLKTVPAATVQAMKLPGARQGLKMACGANPKEHFGSKGRFPSTRMGVIAGMREAWVAAQAYRDGWRAYARGARAEPPVRNLKLDTLAGALEGDIPVHIHCYRSDDMAQLLDMSMEFGFRIAAFHHAVEAYKISALLAQRKVCSAVWADWQAFKAEAYDGIKENAAYLDAAGACVMMHSDVRRVAAHLPIEAAKAMSYGQRAGVQISPERAIGWITSVPAATLGLDDRIGSIAPGMDADLVLWSGNPFSVYTRSEKVFIDGVLLFDRKDRAGQRTPDFELGQPARRVRP